MEQQCVCTDLANPLEQFTAGLRHLVPGPGHQIARRQCNGLCPAVHGITNHSLLQQLTSMPILQSQYSGVTTKQKVLTTHWIARLR